MFLIKNNLIFKIAKLNFILFKCINLNFGNNIFLQYISLCLHYIFAFEAFILYFFIIFFYLLINNYWIIQKIKKLKDKNIQDNKIIAIAKQYTARYNFLIFYGFIYFYFACIFILLKFVVNEPRPICSMLEYYSIINVASERCLSSFPSAHTGVAVIYAFFAYQYFCNFKKFDHLAIKILIIFLCFLCIFIVGNSRIILALHYPLDIISGFLISGVIIYFTYWIKNSRFYQVLQKFILVIINKILY